MPRIDSIRSEVQRLIHAVPFRRFVLTLENGERALIEQADIRDELVRIGKLNAYVPYDQSEDVRWLYVGCRCPACGLTGCYGDWKNEFIDYRNLLARV